MPAELAGVRAPALYARVSSEEQVSGTSLDDQVDKCLKQAAVYGWTIPRERVFIDDGYSGASLERPAMARLRAAIEAGEVDCVLVYKLDRLSRNIRDTVNIVLEEWSKQHQVMFRSVTEDFNTNSPLGTLIFSILASFAHFERDVIRDRTENGRRRRFAQGRRAVGDAPYGYTRGEVNGTMVVNPEQAEVVRRIFRLYIQGHGFMRIAGMLNSAGITTTRGGLWTDKTVRDVVLNKVYLGQVKYSGECAAGSHEPIIDEDTYNAAQAVRERRDQIGPQAVGSSFLLSGIVRCKGCGHMMYTQPGTESRRRRKDGSEYVTYNHAYYQCGGRIKKGCCTCGHLQQAQLEAHVAERIKKRFGGQVATVESVSRIQDEMNAHIREVQADLKRLAATIQEKEQAIARWESAFERGELSADRFSHRVDRLAAEVAGLDRNRTELGERLTSLQQRRISADWVTRVARQVDTWDTLPFEIRKQLVHFLIDHIRVWKPSLGRGKHKNNPEIEVDIVWNRAELALPAGDLEGLFLTETAASSPRGNHRAPTVRPNFRLQG